MLAYKEGGTFLSESITAYDANGDMTEVFSYHLSTSGHITFSRKFDSRGNWIEMNERIEGDKNVTITRRTITYYSKDETP